MEKRYGKRTANASCAAQANKSRRFMRMNMLFIIQTDDGETIYNAMRLANVGVKKGDHISVFMLGKGVLFEKSGTEQFNVMEQINQFTGDFYV
ncbi:MAG: hypothetical protein MUO63_02805 [Desulfobulbaceae bacterium]|nr:hypothetical protein [Desulfobulbaceae bacterium]